MKKILNRLLILSLAVIIGISGINAKNVELDVESKKIQNLYKPFSSFLNKRALGDDSDLFGYLFQKDAYTANELSDEAKMVITGYKILFTENNYGEPVEVTKDEIFSIMKSIFGSDIEYHDLIVNNNTKNLFLPVEYKNGVYRYVYGGGMGPISYFESSLIKAIETDSTIEIYENVVYADHPTNSEYVDDNNSYYDIYTPDRSNLIAKKIKDADIKNYMSYGYVYKYTFNFDSTTNEYYFSKIEKIDYNFNIESDDDQNTKNNNSQNIDENNNINYLTIGIILGISLFSIITIFILIKKKN